MTSPTCRCGRSDPQTRIALNTALIDPEVERAGERAGACPRSADPRGETLPIY